MNNKKLDKKNIEDILALTPMQEGILFHYISNPKSRQYFEQLSLRLNGPFDLEVLQKTWNFVAENNEILRTFFRWDKLEKPVQIVLRNYEIPVRYYDISMIDKNIKIKNLEEIKLKDREESLNISKEPFRITFCKLEVDNFEMIISNHHILYDGWSNAILLKEFFHAYQAIFQGENPVRPVKNRYREFVKWQKNHETDSHKKFWTEYLQDFENKTVLPCDKRNHENAEKGEVFTLSLSESNSEGIKNFAREHRLALASVLYAAWGIMLLRFSDTDDVIFGTTVSGRTAKIKDIEDIAGLFINTPPLRIRLRNGENVLEFLNGVENSIRERGLFENTSLTKIKEYSSLGGNDALFDSIMVIENYPLDKQLGNENRFIRIDDFSIFEMTNFDIAIAVSVFENLEIKFIYNGNKFYSNTIKRLAEYFQNIVEQIINNPLCRVSDIEILTCDQRNWLINSYNDTATLYPREKTLSQLFEEQVRMVPENTALVFGENKMTYRELNEKANKFANFLRNKGVGKESIVGLLLERSFDMIKAILGILKAGGAYLPIDPEYPCERVVSIINDSGTKVLVTQKEIYEKICLSEHFNDSSIEMLLMNGTDTEFENENPENLESISTSDNSAYVMYTSGSTGLPKGTLTMHHNISRVVKDTNYIDITDKDTLLQLSNYAFDGSTFDIFGALLNGAKLVLVSKKSLLDMEELSKIIRQQNISVFFVTTALFNTLVDVNIECFKNVRKVLFGGERVSVPHVRKAFGYMGPGRIIHVYGPTESTVFASFHPIDKVGSEAITIPIGKQLANTRLYIVDKNNKLQPFGAQGELCIAGDGLARGYLNRPELTAEKFVPDPFWSGSGQGKQELMYKTGDLVKWLPDGSIEFLDRIDTQVKLRGFRIELGEIEACLLQYNGIKEAVVLAKEDKNGNKFLCAYYTSRTEIGLSELREYLSGKLPVYMVPACFVRMEIVPLNSNGKIDKKKLPEPYLEEKEYVPPEGGTEVKLAGLWKDVLGVETVGANDNFFELGGHSLKATVLAARIHKEFNKSVPLEKVLNTRDLRELAGYLEDAEEKVYSRIKPVNEDEAYINAAYPEGVYPSSASQQRMYVQQQFEGIGTSYNMPLAMNVEGELDISKVEETLKTLIMRHEPFRTSFEIYNGEVVQRIHKEIDFKVTYLTKSRDKILRELIKPFDLGKAPLIRATVLNTGDKKHIFLLDMHHIISDGISITVLVGEFEQIYKGLKIAEPEIQYKDFSYWHNNFLESKVIKKQKEYWRNVLEGIDSTINMPSDYSRSDSRTFYGDSVSFNLDSAICESLNLLSHKYGVTINVLLLALYTTLLYRYTGQQDIAVGSLVAGRNHPDVEGMIGMFNNFLPIRSRIEPSGTFTEFIGSVNDTVMKAYENQDYPYDRMVENFAGRTDITRNPLFDTMLILHNELHQEIVPRIDGLLFEIYDLNSFTSKLDFKLDVYMGKSNIMNCVLEYNTGIFKKETMERFVRHFINIVDEIVTNPGKKICEIGMLTSQEKSQILFDFNNTEYEYPIEKTISRVFEEQAEKTPDNIAVMFGDEKLTYRELNQRANSLARVLRERGVKGDSIVAVMLDRSLEMITGILAVLKAGGAYLPVSPDYPEERVRYILKDSGTSILLTNRDAVGRWTPEVIAALEVKVMNLDDSVLYEGDSSNLEKINTSRNLAYIIYTSGSTGKPKGAMIEHYSVINRISWMQRKYPIGNEDVILQKTTYTFDVSVWELFWWFFAGAKVYFLAPGGEKDPGAITDAIEKQGVTTMHFVPSMLNMFLEYMENGKSEDKISSLKQVFASGEALQVKQVQRFNQLVGSRYGTKLINLYGPTEATVDVSYFDCPQGTDIDLVPIGKPIDNIQLYVVDKYNNMQPVGIPGELCISGDGLARGYLNRPELTAEKFVHNPFAGENAANILMYRTGDLARWLPDGNIEYLGRIDHQVKIRGFRIELGEIEEELLKHENIKEVVVAARTEKEGSSYLCAYLIADRDIAPGELREYLTRNLPEYMVPSYFVRLEKMPLSQNGKVDRKALPEPQFSVNTGTEYVEPANEDERKMVKLWQEVLDIDRIGINDNFFEMGGHSLKAAVLVSKIQKEFSVEISLSEIFKASTVKEITSRLKALKGSIYSSILHVDETEYLDTKYGSYVYPVSSAQKRLFILEQMGGLGTTYNLPGVIQVEGKIDIEAFENAFIKLIERHETLRTSFKLFDGKPFQIVQKSVDFKLGYKEQGNTGIDEIIRMFIRVFELGTAPLFRAELVKLNNETHLLMFDMHHIISDGVSSVILVKEFIDIYRGANLPELRVQYRDYALWQNKALESEILEKQQKYWLDVFSGELPVLNMPLDYPRPSIQSYEGDRITFTISKKLADTLKDITLKTGSTLYMVLLCAYNILLNKYTGQEDIIVGSPTAGRPHADLENLAGMFVNTLALRNFPKGDKTFIDFLEEVKKNVVTALENQDYQFESLIENLKLKRDLSRNSLFDTLFVLQNMGMPETDVNGLKFTPYKFGNRVSKFDLTLEAVESSEGITFNLEYCTALFKRETIESLLLHFQKILESIAENPQILISQIEMLTTQEKSQILFDFNNTVYEYPRDKTISCIFEEQAEKTPDNIAVIFGDEKLTYRELNQRANSLARVLRKQGVKGDSIVAVMLDRSLEMITGILAVLKAGGAYLPVSPDYPEERVRYILKDSGTSILLTNRDAVGRWTPEVIASLEVTVMNLNDSVLYEGDRSNLEKINTSRNLAYIIYTSGSTGKPKGAMIEHYSVINRINWMQRKYPIGNEDVILQKTTYTFDVSVWELFWWFFAGAKVYFLVPGGEKDPGAITDAIEKQGVTTMHFVPSMLNMFLEYMENGKSADKISSLKQVFASGEALQVKQVQRFNQLVGSRYGTKLINLYGPTEATVDVSYFDCPQGTDIDLVPIGKPIDNIQLYVVDKYNNMQPVGIPGELCISGDGLARGYLNRPELTAEKFVHNPFAGKDASANSLMYRTGDLARWLPDGNIEYLGRIDHQVKIRGFRIELGEIEEELLKHENIKEVVVAARTEKEGSSYLCAYLIADRDIAPGELREYLTRSLPEYMVPSYFVRLEKMPLSQNGKVDRKALPEPQFSVNTGTEYIEPIGKTEKILADIWRQILKIERVGTTDNFFDLGGTSLTLIQVHSKIEEKYPGKVKITDIFSNPTISKLSAFIEIGEENSTKDISLEFLEFPQQYFLKEGGDYGSVFKFRLNNDVLRGFEKTDVLICAFVYLLGQITQKVEITIQTMVDDCDRVYPISLDLKEAGSFGELCEMVYHQRSCGKSSGYDLKDLREESIENKSNFSILPVFYKKNLLSTPQNLTGVYDIALGVSEENEQTVFICEYNSTRLRGDKIKELTGKYLKVVQFITSNK
ncbi:non-ribosomal peptide synthetase [Clostridium sp. BNL1100]|uniref:non-ribosomal peptide synthetase n=1 Tax=Clostridium sp. BNL1100 TaxID=755731 RepID=UPI00024A74B7|nr:non-ribosomal peptide synthetase [Clostridium sp. BNL1100]AEY65543.1 amino acid adenylation enzyme/thioester reductase family protein [Clostridium sp. BNL1100]